jgi:hypothetical protein
MLLELKNHQVWQNLNEILENLDADTLIKEHLELSKYKVCGYWDDQNNYYEEIILPHTLEAQLISSSIGVTNKKRFLQMRFSLTHSNNNLDDNTFLGELLLIYNENLEFIDENWYLDIESPFIEKPNLKS